MHWIHAKTILSANNGMNLYRGCLHGCIYCDSRSACYRMDHDFEDVAVKENAIELLETALKRKRKKGMLGIGAMSDPYLPLEETLRMTRQALELALRYGFGFTLITKSARVLRDLDLLAAINEKTKCVVQMTLTTMDERLCQTLEPNVSTTKERIHALGVLRDAGIPTIVWLCPILPFINDSFDNIARILQACVDVRVKGIVCFGMGVTLREGNRTYFYEQLDRFFPGMKNRYQQAFGDRYACGSPRNQALMEYFHAVCEQNGILHDNEQIFAYLQQFESKEKAVQLSLFE